MPWLLSPHAHVSVASLPCSWRNFYLSCIPKICPCAPICAPKFPLPVLSRAITLHYIHKHPSLPNRNHFCPSLAPLITHIFLLNFAVSHIIIRVCTRLSVTLIALFFCPLRHPPPQITHIYPFAITRELCCSSNCVSTMCQQHVCWEVNVGWL